MSGWGIAETAPVIEKIKAESADYLRGLNSCGDITWSVYDKAFDFYMELISRAYEQGKKDEQPKRTEERTETHACDCISRQMLLEYIHGEPVGKLLCDKYNLDGLIEQLPSAQPEPLTDKEQRIFLAAMEREEKVCEEVDRNYVREPYEDSLARICHEITRKVKGALWTI